MVMKKQFTNSAVPMVKSIALGLTTRFPCMIASIEVQDFLHICLFYSNSELNLSMEVHE